MRVHCRGERARSAWSVVARSDPWSNARSLEKRGQRRDRYGVGEWDPTLGMAKSAGRPRDRAADGAVAQHHPQGAARRHGAAGIAGSGAAEQARSGRSRGGRKRKSPGNNGGPGSNARRSRSPWATPAPTPGSRPSRATGRPTASEGRSVPAAAPSSRWSCSPGRCSSRTGQFERSEDRTTNTGENTQRQIALIELSPSRAFLLCAYLRKTQNRLFDAHRHALRVFGGVPGRGISDKMKTAVDRVDSGKARQVDARCPTMTGP